MADPLAQYRRRPAAGAVTDSETTPPKGGDEYVAFDAKDKVDRLTILRANDPSRAPSYPYLLDISYDGHYGTNFVLTYTFMMVLVRGKNLQPVVAALKTGMASFIQEFDPARWKKPEDSKAPFIQSIQVVVQGSAVSMSESEKSGKTKLGNLGIANIKAPEVLEMLRVIENQ